MIDWFNRLIVVVLNALAKPNTAAHNTGPLGWETFLTAFNDFCSEHHGVPQFNQTKWITRHQARKAFGVRLEQFEQERRGLDPKGRLLNEYFREKLS